MSVAGGDGGQPKALSQRLREGVLTLVAAAVERFDSADVSIGGVGDGALQRLRPVAPIAQLEGELAAVGVSGDESAAGLIDEASELSRSVHAVDVSAQAEGEEVAVVGVHLDAVEDGEVVAAGQLPHLFRVPNEVVLGEADSVEAGGLGGLDQIVRREEGIVGEGLSVGVEVDEHVGYSLPQPEGRGIGGPSTDRERINGWTLGPRSLRLVYLTHSKRCAYSNRVRRANGLAIAEGGAPVEAAAIIKAVSLLGPLVKKFSGLIGRLVQNRKAEESDITELKDSIDHVAESLHNVKALAEALEDYYDSRLSIGNMTALCARLHVYVRQFQAELREGEEASAWDAVVLLQESLDETKRDAFTKLRNKMNLKQLDPEDAGSLKEAIANFDASHNQVVGFVESRTLGGLIGQLSNMKIHGGRMQDRLDTTSQKLVNALKEVGA